MNAVVVGLGNPFRRDDGIGPAVADHVAALGIPGVQALACLPEPTAVLDAWAGADLAVVVDAAAGGVPGRVRRCGLAELDEAAPVSSHGMGLRQIHDLAVVLDRAPRRLAVLTVDVADCGHGPGLSPAVAAALPEAVRAVRDVLLEQSQEAAHQQP